MANVLFERVTKRFDSSEAAAVDSFDLEIPDKEFLVLVGPSGSGKSTALRLLAGLEAITEGNIYIGDRLVNNVAAKDRDIAMVFQSYALYPHMTVFDNMAFGLTLRKIPKEEIRRRVHEAAGLLGIEPLLNRKPRALSGGQRQRVALGRAIVREPAVFLLDEPLSNLDAQLRVQTRAEISKLHQRLGTTFIYVTHDQVEAMTMATKIVVMNQGSIQQVGTPQDLYETPRNLFVAGFIGSPAMNFFNGTVVQSGPALKIDVGGFAVPAPQAAVADLQGRVGHPIVLGLRPENIHARQFTPAGIRSAEIEVTVDVTELMGNEVILYVIHGEHQFLARVDPRVTVRPGQTIGLALDIDRFHLFDAETQAAIGLPTSVTEATSPGTGPVASPPSTPGGAEQPRA